MSVPRVLGFVHAEHEHDEPVEVLGGDGCTAAGEIAVQIGVGLLLEHACARVVGDVQGGETPSEEAVAAADGTVRRT